MKHYLLNIFTHNCDGSPKFHHGKFDVILCRLLELVATSVANFTVKHFLLEQEGALKQFSMQIIEGNLIADEKCAIVHKYLQYFQQKLLDQQSWGPSSESEVLVA